MTEFNGKWNAVMETPVGTQEGILVLQQEGDKLTGSLSNHKASDDIQGGKVKNGEASWSIKIQKPMPLTLKFVGKLENEDIVGTVKFGMLGKSTFRGTPA